MFLREEKSVGHSKRYQKSQPQRFAPHTGKQTATCLLAGVGTVCRRSSSWADPHRSFLSKQPHQCFPLLPGLKAGALAEAAGARRTAGGRLRPHTCARGEPAPWGRPGPGQLEGHRPVQGQPRELPTLHGLPAFQPALSFACFPATSLRDYVTT